MTFSESTHDCPACGGEYRIRVYIEAEIQGAKLRIRPSATTIIESSCPHMQVGRHWEVNRDVA